MSIEEEIAFSYLEQHFNEAVNLWIRLVEKESPFWRKQAVDGAVDLMEIEARRFGLYTRCLPCRTTGDGLIISTGPLTDYAHGVTLMAHLDTVHEIGSFGIPVVREENGWLYGPGVGDCKGGAVMAFYKILSLREADYSKRPVKLIYVGNEEGGRPEEENFIPEELRGSDIMLNCETGALHDIVTSRKASIGAVFTVSGTAGHVGKLSSQPASAIRAAVEKIRYLESLSDYKNCIFSCGEISGGSIFTSVPASCTFKVNCRIRSKEDIEWLEKTLQEIAEREDVPGTTTTVHLTGNIIPMVASPYNEKLFDYFNSATISLGYEPFRSVHSGGGSDASYAVLAGVPVLCSTGVLAEGSHTLQERACIADMKKRARIHIRTILSLPEGPVRL